MNFLNNTKNFNNSIFYNLVFIFIFLLFIIVLFIRGEGWDGDSITNIAQFNKLIFFDLYGTPDGTTPKLFPILIFGGFHFLFNSYSIHWPVILLCSYAFTKATLLPINKGGGFLWFFLPFTSKTLIYAIISADNPALAIGFYVLAITFSFEKKILKSFVFLLLAEFSRPGYSVLMILTLFFFLFNNSLNIKKNTKIIIIVIILILIALLHSIYCYKLAYPDFNDYNVNNWNAFRFGVNEYSDFFINNKFKTLIMCFNGIFASILSNILFIFPFSIIAILCLILSFHKLKDNTTILFLQPVIYFPFFFSAIARGTIQPDFHKTYFFGNLYGADPYYFITFIPVVLFGIAIFLNKIIAKNKKINKLNLKKIDNKKINLFLLFFKNQLAFLRLPLIATLIALILSFSNGVILKGKYEWNPLQSNPIQSIASTHVLSDPLVNKIIIEVFNQKEKKIKILTTCDHISILIDNAKYIKKISFASQNIFFNKDKDQFVSMCYNSIVKKRSDDILLHKSQKYDASKNFDILYTTNDMLKFFKIPSSAKIINLKLERVLIINNS